MKTNTEKSIEFINDCQDDYEELQEEGNNKGILEVIRLLRRGEKFEKMWERFKRICWHDSVKRIMNEHEQKYFPKPKPKDEIIKLIEKLDKDVRGLLNGGL